MQKKSIKAALSTSIGKERSAVRDRFERADALLRAAGHGAERRGAPAERVVRDTFSLPSSDYDLIGELRERCLKAGRGATKSEIVRAGLHALSALPAQELARVLAGLVKVKTGRPAKP
jgi:Arc/MetJ-type ribon-helix-helix transcriptional regulator